MCNMSFTSLSTYNIKDVLLSLHSEDDDNCNIFIWSNKLMVKDCLENYSNDQIFPDGKVSVNIYQENWNELHIEYKVKLFFNYRNVDILKCYQYIKFNEDGIEYDKFNISFRESDLVNTVSNIGVDSKEVKKRVKKVIDEMSMNIRKTLNKASTQSNFDGSLEYYKWESTNGKQIEASLAKNTMELTLTQKISSKTDNFINDIKKKFR